MKRKPIVVFLIAGLCFLVSLWSCSKKEQPPRTASRSNNQVVVSGSAVVTPLLRTLAQEFSKTEPDIEIVFPPDAHSAAGIAGASENQYDIGTVSRELSPEERAGPLRYLHLAIDELVFVTSADVKVQNLNTEQIQGIFSGEITNWAEVGGPNAKIALIDRPEYTSAKLTLRRTFLGSNLRIVPDTILVERPWQVITTIQLIPFSLGYTSLAEVANEALPVNLISINGVAPTIPNVRAGAYKFFRPLGLVLGPTPKASTMQFVNYIFSENGSRIIENSAYIPLRYEILIGIVPEQNILVQEHRYRPLANYLSTRLENRYAVKLKLFPTYIEVCRSLARGEINAAFLGSLAYATVRRYVDVLARPDYHGASKYRGLIFVRAGSGIDSIEQMRGKRLVMGGRTTTAGYVFPLYYFKKHGIYNLSEYFSETAFAGTHEDAILAVLHGQADVGAAKDLIVHMLGEENPAVETSLKVIARSAPVPSNSFVIRKDVEFPCFDCHRRTGHSHALAGEVPPEVHLPTLIQYLLLNMANDPAGREVLAAIGDATGFVETRDSDYAELYAMLDEIGLNAEDLLSINENSQDQ